MRVTVFNITEALGIIWLMAVQHSLAGEKCGINLEYNAFYSRRLSISARSSQALADFREMVYSLLNWRYPGAYKG